MKNAFEYKKTNIDVNPEKLKTFDIIVKNAGGNRSRAFRWFVDQVIEGKIKLG